MKKRKIILAGGCFWGVEKYFSLLDGIISTTVVYANGNIDRAPTYEEVCSSETGFVEGVLLKYNSDILSLKTILELFFKVINPTTINKQGDDIGTQYRSGIYYQNDDLFSKKMILDFLISLKSSFVDPIATEIGPIKNYYVAEDYHQNYLDKNPGGYCHIGLNSFLEIEKVNIYTKKNQEFLKNTLSELEYNVTQNSATEKPFENIYDENYNKGIYVDITTGEPLFLSSDKFDSGCGWPAFSKPINSDLIDEVDDFSNNKKRTEVRSKTGDSHLGHVFKDGPEKSGGLRYCINSASLKFIEIDDMEKLGYKKYIEFVK